MEEQDAAGLQEASPDDTLFAFEVPDCQPGAVMKVTAPDGVTLHIPRSVHVLAGDMMHMKKGEDGKWGIKHVVRTEAVSQSTVNPTEMQKRNSDSILKELEGPHVNIVRLTTTKGPILLQIVPAWAPLGVQRFLQLVANNYYSDLAIYRAVANFLVQFGVVKDQERNDSYEAIADDSPRGVPVEKGSVCFAASGPNTRKATICLFLDDFPQLGNNPWETPIGKVHPDSMDTLLSIFTGYGDMPQCGGQGPDPIKLLEEGNDYIKSNFPDCDFIENASWEH
mmetsp:Transcript_68916/g.149964  ORF Transcript_68916/g.149964 Transcript_68916/m.149964 type:complete len:280 (+) Transcript_68916:91-930(+)|eukprot:CAMPEP_0170582162 /NCGR_PEP_ID=MMETSP0224-20130122/7432_1 /TAXON_ID=285029 /ORGANISM="Togula jolla, Strain CCCM 725" /LENGTH=279 /DNA_ID=CAMNT_0010905359 /DNA_START=53 /DNA_END=892 /DNA_ORIENTATION=-